jgi:spore coat protein U-like protein
MNAYAGSGKRPRRMHARSGCLLAMFGLVLPTMAAAGANCSVTALSINFGVYDPTLNLPDDSTGSVTVTCTYVPPDTARVNYVVSIANGQNSASAMTRQMGSGGEARLAYNVYDDPGRTRIWGNGFGGTVVATGKMALGPGVGNSTRTMTHTIYARIPGLQDAVPGTYLDSLVVTLTY